jgi:dihydroflavonol-4-reductase
MKIFITGATGFIGSHLVKRLAQTKHEMVCLVRRSSNVSVLKNLHCTLVTGDVTDKSSLQEGMKGCDWVINLANLYSMWVPDKSLYHKINVIGTRNVMESALATGASRVVHVSTVAVYGKPAELPFTEESEPGPVLFSEYARTKAEGDKIAWDLHNNKSLPLTTIYPGICLGAGDTKASGDYIKLLIRRLLPIAAFSKSILTCVHVGDVAEAIVRILEKPETIGQRYLVGNSRLSIREFNALICQAAKVSQPVLYLPGPVAVLAAYLLTGISNLIKVPPPFGMSTDQARTMDCGFEFNGEKITREFGMPYSNVQNAVVNSINEMNCEI